MNPVVATTLTFRWKPQYRCCGRPTPPTLALLWAPLITRSDGYVNRTDEHFAEDGYDRFW